MGAFDGKNLIVSLAGYRAYFDASKDSEMMLVAGYLSTVEAWEQFEIEWKLKLAKYDVPYFHMKDFTAKKKAFAAPKWNSESYRARFMSDLVQIIRDWTIASVGCGMKQELFEQYNKVYRLDERFNTYAICGRDCAAQVRSYVRKELKSGLPIAYVFEDGDEGKGFLDKEMRASLLPYPEFKRPRPDPKNRELDKDDPPHVQLQACDLSAWELRRGEKDLSAGKRGEEIRKSLRALHRVDKRIWKQTKEPDLKGLIQVAGIKLR